VKKNKKSPAKLPDFHDPVARYLAAHRRHTLDGMALPVISVPVSSIAPEDWSLIQKVGREATQIGLS